MENWPEFGGSRDRFDKDNWRRRGLYEDLSITPGSAGYHSSVKSVFWFMICMPHLKVNEKDFVFYVV